MMMSCQRLISKSKVLVPKDPRPREPLGVALCSPSVCSSWLACSNRFHPSLTVWRYRMGLLSILKKVKQKEKEVRLLIL
jgi:hypothetical protein